MLVAILLRIDFAEVFSQTVANNAASLFKGS